MAKSSNSSHSEQGPATIRNRRAGFDYEFIEHFETGVVLIGSEVKSIYQGKGNLTDAYCMVRESELWMISSDIEPYDHTSHFQPERRRDRKLLMHRKQIDLLMRRSTEKGLAIIPTKLYFKNGKVKVDIALARGKRSFDKRESIAKKESKREVERARSMKD
jgi:SsrA-binding protein